MSVPKEVRLYRLVHVRTLDTLLSRGALHAPNFTPEDGLPCRFIHDESVQASRHDRRIPCGRRGACHDYVPFYFGPCSVMLLKLKTGQVDGYDEGQEPLVYLTTTLSRIQAAGISFVFSDGHGLARFTSWYEHPDDLNQVDWALVGARYWADTPEDNDRQRRKQAEFLVWQKLDWALIDGIAVLNKQAKAGVADVLKKHPTRPSPDVQIRAGWYY